MDPLYIPLFFGGGARKPVLDADALQWAVGYESDGSYTDKLAATVGVASPEATGVYVLESAGSDTITIPASFTVGDVTNGGSATVSSVTSGVITFGAGTIYDVEIVGVGFFSCEEGFDLPYDISQPSGNHATAKTATWGTTTKKSGNLLRGFRRSSDAYSTTEPEGGWVRDFDPMTATQGQLFDFIATLINDARYGWQDYTITPGYTPLRTFDPNTSSINDLYDVVGTLGDDLPTTSNAYTLTAPTTNLYTFDPNDGNINDAYDVIGTLLIDLQTYGVIG